MQVAAMFRQRDTGMYISHRNLGILLRLLPRTIEQQIYKLAVDQEDFRGLPYTEDDSPFGPIVHAWLTKEQASFLVSKFGAKHKEEFTALYNLKFDEEKETGSKMEKMNALRMVASEECVDTEAEVVSEEQTPAGKDIVPFSQKDLVLVEGSEEPRVSHHRLAAAFGLRPDALKRLIDDLSSQSERFGVLHTNVENPGKKGGRPKQHVMLSRKQAELVILRSDSPKCLEFQEQVLAVFAAWREGKLGSLQQDNALLLQTIQAVNENSKAVLKVAEISAKTLDAVLLLAEAVVRKNSPPPIPLSTKPANTNNVPPARPAHAPEPIKKKLTPPAVTLRATYCKLGYWAYAYGYANNQGESRRLTEQAGLALGLLSKGVKYAVPSSSAKSSKTSSGSAMVVDSMQGWKFHRDVGPKIWEWLVVNATPVKKINA